MEKKTKLRKIITKNDGITLIALVITIIVLLILAAVSITTLTGENGILTKADESKVQYVKAEIKEEIERAILEIAIQDKEENPQLRLENEKIIKELPNKLDHIIINNDMTGKYKGYNYWIDESNHVHIEKEKNITEPKTYLYKEGEEYIELTGGWKKGASNITGTLSKEENHLNLYCNSPNTYDQTWITCQTTNGIDISGYTKINYKYEIDHMISINGKYCSWITIGICDPMFESYSSNNILASLNNVHSSDTDISKQIQIGTLDITGIDKIVYPTIGMMKWYNTNYVCNVKIYEIWLER